MGEDSGLYSDLTIRLVYFCRFRVGAVLTSKLHLSEVIFAYTGLV